MRWFLYIALFFTINSSGQLFDRYLPLALQQAGGDTYPDLYGYYRFDSNTSDAKGNLADASHSGTTIGVVDSRDCLDFGEAANDNYATVGHDDTLEFTDGAGNDDAFSVSFMAWINDVTQFIVSKRDDANDGWEIRYNGAGNYLEVYLYTDSSNYLAERYSISAYRDNWHHFVITYDGSETLGGLNAYADSNLLSAGDISTGTYTGIAATTGDMVFGAAEPDLTADNLVNGMSNVGIWTKELSSTEVDDIYDIEVTQDDYLLPN